MAFILPFQRLVRNGTVLEGELVNKSIVVVVQNLDHILSVDRFCMRAEHFQFV